MKHFKYIQSYIKLNPNTKPQNKLKLIIKYWLSGGVEKRPANN